MCTVSWLRAPGGFELFSNRDERHVRGPEEPPSVARAGALRFLAPRDGDAGGTWIAVNERGLALTLLNGYLSADATPGDYVSRGQLVTDLASAGEPAEVAGVLGELELSRYRSFVLLALAPEGPSHVFDWDGVRLAVDRDADVRSPLVSSSFESARVGSARRERFEALRRERGGVDAQLLEEFHADHVGGPSAFSVCMHRDDASTRSQTRVRVTRSAVRLDYRAAPACRPAEVVTLELERTGVAGARAGDGRGDA